MRDTFVTALSACALPGTLVNAHLISSKATLAEVRPTAYPAVGIGHDGLFGRLPGHQLFARGRVDCDNEGYIHCSTRTCYTDSTGLVGYCTVSSCVHRTTCIEYTAGTSFACDQNTGGCMYCSDSASPSCATFTNAEASQWIQYCNDYASVQVVAYPNTVAGSMYQRDDDGSPSTTAQSDAASAETVSATYKTPPCREVIPGATCPSSTESSIATLATVSQSSDQIVGSSIWTSQPNSEATLASTTSVSSVPTSSNEAVIATSDTYGSPTANTNGSGESVSGGEAAGIVCGAAAGLSVVALTIWWMLRRRRARSSLAKSMDSVNSSSITKTEKLQTDAATPVGLHLGPWSTGAELGSPLTRPQSPGFPYHPDHFAGCQPIGEVSEPDYQAQPQQRYTVMNPDPLSPSTPMTTTLPLTDWSAQAPVTSESSLPISRVSLPESPRLNVSTSRPVSPQTSVLGQPHYTSSIYEGGNEPPSSVPRTTNAAPPSLPQDYSIVSLGSSADLYRGVSVRGDGARRPYLSPEDALNGGWRNDED